MLSKIRIHVTTGVASLTLLRSKQPRSIDEYDLLIEAICHQASKDLTGKDLKQKIDAMDFFRSEWFEELTGLDGEDILQELLRKE